jgi:hypothetical protein
MDQSHYRSWIVRRNGVRPLDLGPTAYPSLVVSVRNRWARRTGASNGLLALFIIRHLVNRDRKDMWHIKSVKPKVLV